jgi:hypothetical protein
MRNKIEEAKQKINTVLRGLQKYGIDTNIKSSTTGRHTNNGRSRAHIDPEGIIYEAVLSNPVAGATATLYEKTEAHPEGEIWDAEEWGQENNQITVENGHYQWFVPEGEWQVRVTHPEDRPDLSDNTSADHPNANLDDGSTKGWLPVLPVQLGINIPLVSMAEPTVSGAVIYRDYAQVMLTQYVDAAFLTADNITVRKGEKAVSCNIALPDQDVEPADETVYLARTIRLIPADGEGFEEDAEYTVSISGGAESYNGKFMDAYESEPLKFSGSQGDAPGQEDADLVAPTALSLSYTGVSQNLVLPGSVSKEGAQIQYAIGDDTSLSPAEESYTAAIPKAKDVGEYKVWYRVVDSEGRVIISPAFVKAKIRKGANPAVIMTSAKVQIGAKSYDLSENVKNAAGEVSFAIAGQAYGCFVSGNLFMPGDAPAVVSVRVNVAGDENYNPKTGTITVTVEEKKDDGSSSGKDDGSSSGKDDGSSSGKDDSSSSSKGDDSSMTQEKRAAIAAMKDKKASPKDTLVLTQNGKKLTLKTEKGGVLTVVKGAKFEIENCVKGQNTTDNKKLVAVNAKGKVSAKKPAENTKIGYKDQVSGNEITVSVNVIEPMVVGGKKLTGTVPAGQEFDLVTTVPLNAVFGTPVNKGSVSGLVYTGEEAVGDDGKIHIKGKADKKGTVTIPFTADGKKFKLKIKVSK